MSKFDIAVMGGGPAGYVAAIAAAQEGKSVALIEATEVGGTCLNRGCIPSKALLSSAELMAKIREAHHHGIKVEGLSFDYAKMVQRKQQVVSNIVKGLSGLLKANKITVFRGYGKFISPREIKVLGQDNVLIEAEKTIIATGSEPLNIPAFPFDHNRILSSTSVLELKQLPKRIAIIGGGFIGCEFASLFVDLGVEVVLIEMLPDLISNEGKEVSQALLQAFKAKNIDIRLNTKVEKITYTETGISVALANQAPPFATIEADLALVAVGRKLNTDDIGLERIGLSLTERGVIPINDKMETAVPDIYAAGDVTGKWLLAHVASHQGIIAARNACGHKHTINYEAIPSVVYTRPEIATVGLTLDKALSRGYEAAIGKFPFQALGKAQATGEPHGFAQVVIDKKTHQILGAQAVGYAASALIAEMTVAIQNELTAECIEETLHAHPSLPEAWQEATFLAVDKPIHLPPKPKRG